MVIGIANNLMSPYGRGSGAEVIAEKMAAEYRLAGHEVFIISTKPKNEQMPDSHDHYFLPSSFSKLSQWSPLRKLNWHLSQLLLPWHRQKLKQIISARKPDIFITHNLIGLGYCLPKILYQNNIRHEHVLHDIQLLHPSGLMYWGQEKIITSPLAKIYQRLTRRALAHATQIISPSQWLLTLHQKHNFFKLQTCAVKLNFTLQKKEPKTISSPLHFIFTGQLEKHKGLTILLEAWKEAGLSATEAKLSIAGSGSMLKYVQAQVKSQTNLEYVGFLDRPGIEQLLQRSDVVILPSLVYENSPTSLWEAAAHGLRALASDLGGIPELKPFLELKLFPPGDVGALAASIKQSLKS